MCDMVTVIKCSRPLVICLDWVQKLIGRVLTARDFQISVITFYTKIDPKTTKIQSHPKFMGHLGSISCLYALTTFLFGPYDTNRYSFVTTEIGASHYFKVKATHERN